MNIQFFSDVHLEFGTLAPLSTSADVLIAAGDIDVGARGVEWLCQFDKPVVYVAGNHEYYGGEIGAVQDAIRAAAAGTNVTFLENEATVIDGVRFLGATLWTDFMGNNPALMARLSGQMNDYQQIRCGMRSLEPTDLARLHLQSRRWLEAELARPHPGQTVVVTHHAPLFASWNNNGSALFKGAYCNDLSTLVASRAADLWVHGHVHSPSDYYAGRLRVVCNPRGYDGYQLVDGFNYARAVTL